MDSPATPASVDEARELLLRKASGGAQLAVIGGGTRAEPTAPILAATGLNGLRFFDPDDLVVGVEAGFRFRDLQHLLAAKGMTLPVAPWFPDATLGGMVAANDWGCERLDGGGLRDALIGLEYLDARGTLIKSGGKVVKNVTGYDLARMFIGSRGGLGLITAVNFKCQPLPVEPHALFLETDNPTALMQTFGHGVFARKVPLDWVQVMGRRGGWTLGMGISGNAERREQLVCRLQHAFQNRLTPAPDHQIPEPFQDFQPARRTCGFLAPFRTGPDGVHLHLITTNRFFLENDGLKLLEDLSPQAVVAHPIGADAHLFFAEPLAQRTSRAVEHLARHGFVDLVRVEPQVRAAFGNVHPKPAAFAVQRRLKAAMDPDNLFHAPYYEAAP